GVRYARTSSRVSGERRRHLRCLGFALEFGEGRGSSFQYLDPSWTWRATNSNAMSFGRPRQLRKKTRSADSTIESVALRGDGHGSKLELEAAKVIGGGACFRSTAAPSPFLRPPEAWAR